MPPSRFSLNDLSGSAVCRCGHQFARHYNGRGDCAERCGCTRFRLPEMTVAAVDVYLLARQETDLAGYSSDITWQESVNIEAFDGGSFVAEAAFVVLNSGMRATVVRSRWPAFRAAFRGFADLHAIATDDGSMRTAALKAFNHVGKVEAVFAIAEMVDQDGWDAIRQRIDRDGLTFLRSLPFIGPVTSFHLAKNLGMPVGKPDRHLQRIADRLAGGDVQALCRTIGDTVGVSVPVVDIVLWRWASINPHYLSAVAAMSLNVVD